MAGKALKLVFGGLAVGGVVFYGRAYVDVYFAESNVSSIRQEIKNKEEERVTLEKKIRQNQTDLFDLERQGGLQLKEQEKIQGKIKGVNAELRALKSQLQEKKKIWSETQSKIVEFNNDIRGLRHKDSQTLEEIKVASVLLKAAETELQETKEFANPLNQPIIKKFFGRE